FLHGTDLNQVRAGDRLGVRGLCRWDRRKLTLTLGLGRPCRHRDRSADDRDGAVARSGAEPIREHSEGTTMSPQVMNTPDADSEARWRTWQARGAANDRRTAKMMRGLMMLIAAGFA